MKYVFLMLLLFCLLPNQYVFCKTSVSELPAWIKSDLNKRFPGWRLPKIPDDISGYLKENISPDARGDVVSGDFDGNGEPDYAILIEYGVLRNEEGVAVEPAVHLVAYLKRKNGKFKFYRVDDGNEYLVLMKKGEKDYDFETDKNFYYKNDAVFSGIFEKAGTSYIFEKGKFRAVITSD